MSAELAVYWPPSQGVPVQAGVQQLQCLQAMQWHVSAAVPGKAILSSMKAQQTAFQLGQRSEESLH